VASLDREWAVGEIDAFLHSSDRVASSTPGLIGVFQRDPDKVVAGHAYVVERILDQVLPGWKGEVAGRSKGWEGLRDQAARARAALQREEELAARLGDGAPTMDAGALHPWAWENGASYWRTGHFHQSVMQASVRINAETQAKLGRMGVSETALFNEAFTLDAPKAHAPRMRLMADDGSDTYRNLHRGARAYAEGLYAAIRNPGIHRPSGLGVEQLALEQLAAFSVLARWVDEATVQTV